MADKLALVTSASSGATPEIAVWESSMSAAMD